MTAAPFYATVGDERVEVRPLTVRDRMKLANLLAENARTKALEMARDCELSARERAEFVAEKVAEAEKFSALVMSCWTMEGAMAVVALACDKEGAELLGTLEPGEFGSIAARALNVDVGRADGSSSGKK